MTRYMADACNPANLPGWELQASYVDGICAVTRTDLVRISSIASDGGLVGDVEPGNPGWSTWIDWVVRRRSHGTDPTLYCCDDGVGGPSWDGWRHADGVAAFAAAGVPEPHWWVFNFNLSDVPPYAVAVQVADNVPPGYDISIVADYWPGVDRMTPEQEAKLDRLLAILDTGPAARTGGNAGDLIADVWLASAQADGSPSPFVGAIARAVAAALPVGTAVDPVAVATAVLAQLKAQLSK